jgi:hypothetical protein
MKNLVQQQKIKLCKDILWKKKTDYAAFLKNTVNILVANINNMNF